LFLLGMPAVYRFFKHLASPPKKARKQVRLGFNRIYILPTKAGLLFFALLLTMLLISINYTNPPGYLLTFLLTGVGLASIFHTHRALFGLLVSRAPTRSVFAGKTAHFQVVIRNPDPLFRHGIRITWSGLDQGPIQDIASKSEARFSLPKLAVARGKLTAGPIVVSSVHPLGLCKAWASVQLAMSCIVYPQPEKNGPKWSPSAKVSADLSKILLESYPAEQDGDDFSGLRKYRLGDPPRQVAWKAMAKSNTLYSKEFSSQGEDTVIWLQWKDANQAEIEATLSRLCRWILEADKTGHPYGLILPNQEISPTTGPAHLDLCLTSLAVFQDHPENP